MCGTQNQKKALQFKFLPDYNTENNKKNDYKTEEHRTRLKLQVLPVLL